jgi:hypothetical protein
MVNVPVIDIFITRPETAIASRAIAEASNARLAKPFLDLGYTKLFVPK